MTKAPDGSVVEYLGGKLDFGMSGELNKGGIYCFSMFLKVGDRCPGPWVGIGVGEAVAWFKPRTCEVYPNTQHPIVNVGIDNMGDERFLKDRWAQQLMDRVQPHAKLEALSKIECAQIFEEDGFEAWQDENTLRSRFQRLKYNLLQDFKRQVRNLLQQVFKLANLYGSRPGWRRAWFSFKADAGAVEPRFFNSYTPNMDGLISSWEGLCWGLQLVLHDTGILPDQPRCEFKTASH